MPELRWALIGLGILFIAGLAIWEWRRSRRRRAQADTGFTATGVIPQGGGERWPRRIEPRIDSLAAARAERDLADRDEADDLPVIHPASAEVSLRVAAETAIDTPRGSAPAGARFDPPDLAAMEPDAVDPVDASSPATRLPDDHAGSPDDATAPEASFNEAAAAVANALPAGPAGPAASSPPPPRTSRVAIRWPPERADRVLTLRLASPQGALLQGRAVRLALEQSGLRHGPQCIYHRVDAHGSVLASAANMLRPGDLDPELMDEQQFRGLSLFCVLPGPLPPVRMLEELVALARGVAWRLGAMVQDDHGEELDGERLVKLRQSLPDAAEHGTA